MLKAALALSAAAAPPLPSWSAPPPNASAPLGGFSPLPNASISFPFLGSLAGGYYNHAAMIGYASGVITVAWKNGVGASPEDAPGQRVLFSQSTDGVAWSRAAELFPSVTAAAAPAALFAGPFAAVNGRLYAAATPGVLAAGDAQGAQFCLWPDGADPRNAGPPRQRQPAGALLLRRVLPGVGALGPPFWASASPPPALAAAAAAAGVLALADAGADAAADAAALAAGAAGAGAPPCDAAGGAAKCEACARGCQDFERLAVPAGLGVANERTHWALPGGRGDMLAYRTNDSALWAAFRPAGGAWPPGVARTSIPNDNSNINAGALPDGRTFLLLNAVPHHVRDPLVIALAADGLDFSAARAALSCTALGAASTCRPRNPDSREVGPSYPQALVLDAPAPAALRAFYVVATNNKEDVVVVRYSFSALDGV